MQPLRILQVVPSLEMGGVEENTIQDAIIFKENSIIPFVFTTSVMRKTITLGSNNFGLCKLCICNSLSFPAASS